MFSLYVDSARLGRIIIIGSVGIKSAVFFRVLFLFLFFLNEKSENSSSVSTEVSVVYSSGSQSGCLDDK